jgi:hypothetical protein
MTGRMVVLREELAKRYIGAVLGSSTQRDRILTRMLIVAKDREICQPIWGLFSVVPRSEIVP